MNRITRKKFIKEVGLATLAVPVLSAFSDCNISPKTKGSKMIDNSDKLGIALVGLGNYAGILASAIKETEHCYVAGIVTGTPSKIARWKEDYDIPDKNVYN